MDVLELIGVTKVECVCPVCGVIEDRAIDTEYLTHPYIWKRAGYPVILCPACKERIHGR